MTRSLKSTIFGVVPCDIPLQLDGDGGLDWHALETAIRPETQCALIQRSCGYSWRKTLTVAEIERAIIIIKASGHFWISKFVTKPMQLLAYAFGCVCSVYSLDGCSNLRV